MKKALLPVAIAAIFASQGVLSADRELLFGPGSESLAKKPLTETRAKKKERGESRKAPASTEKELAKTGREKNDVADAGISAKKALKDVQAQGSSKALDAQTKVVEAPKTESKLNPATAAVSSVQPKRPEAVQLSSQDKKADQKLLPGLAVASGAAVAGTAVAAAAVASTPAAATPAASLPAKVASGASPAVVVPSATVATAERPLPAATNPQNPLTSTQTAENSSSTLAKNSEVSTATVGPQKTPDLKPVAMTAGSDPFLERERLAAQLKDGIAVGFFPSVTGNQDSFSFLKNYLPLANHISARTGALVSFVEERNLSVYRRAILEAKYPVIFVNATIVGDAIKAGYVPLVMGAEDLGAGFVVLNQSRFKTLDDMSNAQFAWSKNAQITMLAQFELAKRNLVDKNKYTDLGTSGRAAALAAVSGGVADVGVMRTTEAKKAVEDGEGKYRAIEGPTVWPASGVWIRKELKDGDFAKKMTESLLEVSPTSTGSAKLASDGFSRGFGVKGQFRAVRAGEIEEKSKIVDVVAKAWPDFVYQGTVNSEAKTANLAMPVFSKNSFGSSKDVVAENAALRTKFKEAFNVGLYPSTSAASDTYNFQTNFSPLSSYLSEATDYSVSLIPEPNANFFVKEISKNTYPAIVIGPSMALAALASGYLPVARGGDFVSPGFLVPANSPIQNISQLANKRIGTARASDAATVGRWELLKQNVGKVTFDYFGGSAQGLAILATGAVDSVLLRSTEAEEIVKQTTVSGVPKYRVIIGYEEVPAISAWVRHDVYDYSSMRKFADALSVLSKTDGGLKAKAFDGIRRGYGTNDAWQASGIEEHTSSVKMVEGLLAANQPVVDDAPVDLSAIDKVRAGSIVYPNPAAKESTAGKMAITKFNK